MTRQYIPVPRAEVPRSNAVQFMGLYPRMKLCGGISPWSQVGGTRDPTVANDQGRADDQQVFHDILSLHGQAKREVRKTNGGQDDQGEEGARQAAARNAVCTVSRKGVRTPNSLLVFNEEEAKRVAFG